MKIATVMQVAVSLFCSGPVVVPPAMAQSSGPVATAVSEDRNIEIYAYIAPRAIAASLGKGGSTSSSSVTALLRTGMIRSIYHETSSASRGSVGQTGTFEREVSITLDKRGKTIDRKVVPEPVGLITTWQHEKPGLAVDIAYYAAGPTTKAGKVRLGSYLQTISKGDRVRVFDRACLFIMSLPRDNAFGDDAVAIVIVSPHTVDPSAALAGGEVVGRYVRH
ncbi:hypothetical protein ABIC65_002980 [Sphingomonas trueperi]|uniref:hypothetical protein n=1 Tax=Sphingomonas trueperi TaxID=53317 RepID=UPI00339B11DA